MATGTLGDTPAAAAAAAVPVPQSEQAAAFAPGGWPQPAPPATRLPDGGEQRETVAGSTALDGFAFSHAVVARGGGGAGNLAVMASVDLGVTFEDDDFIELA